MWYRYGFAHSKLNSIHGFTEIIHYLPLLLTLYFILNWILYEYMGNYLFIFSIVFVVAFTLIMLPIVGSIKKSLIMKGLLLSCISSWLTGFFVAAGRELWRK